MAHQANHEQQQEQQQQQSNVLTTKLPFLPTASITLSLSSLLHSLPTTTAAVAGGNKVSITAPHFSSFPRNISIPFQISSLSLSFSPSHNPSSAIAPRTRISSSATPLLSSLSAPRHRPSEPSAGAFAGRRCSIVWFRSDLRVHDHHALSSASADSLSLLPVFLFDPRDFGKSPSSGFDRTGPHRAQFLIQSVANLRESLRSRGSDLVVRVAKPETELPELARRIGAESIYAHREVSRGEVAAEDAVEAAMEKEGVEVKWFWGSTLYHVDDLPFELENMPLNYGGFREKVKGLKVREVVEAPEQVKELPSQGEVEAGEIPTLMELGLTLPPTPAVSQDGKPMVTPALVGGEDEALERLKRFAAEWNAQPPKGANDSSRDSIYGANFSCKISPWLALGCVSPRFMFEELKKNARRAISPKDSNPTGDGGMNWLTFELLWRDFFRFITKRYSSSKIKLEGVPATACTPSFA